jgi:hypothetical protein
VIRITTPLIFGSANPSPMKNRILLPLLILAAATSSRAGLIYSGVQNIPIPVDLPAGSEGVYLRVSDGTVSGSYPADWNTAPWINPFFGGVDIGNSELLRPVITGSDPNTGSVQIVNLALVTTVSSGSNFALGPRGSSTHVGLAPDQFQLGTPGLIGFVFETTAGGPDYYGWLRMTANNVGAGSIIDWAYEDSGAAILAGDIGAVPEPGTVLFGVACVAVTLCRRRRG